MEFEVKSVELSTGVTLQYAEQGEPSGIPVILLPGGFDSWRAYELVLPALSASIRAFSLTQRGHGDSDKPGTDYHISEFAEDVVAFMDAMQLDAAVVAAHSSSSLIASRLAIDYPGRTLGLALIGGFASMRDKPVAQEVNDVALTLADPVDPGFVREFQESVAFQPVPEAFRDMVVQEALKVPARVWQTLSAAVLAEDRSQEIHKIKAPTLLVWGDKDPASSRNEQEKLRAIENSRLLVYENIGHAPHWEDPGRFASDLVKFIEEIVKTNN